MQQTKSSNATTIGNLVALKKQEQQNQLTPYMMFKYSIRSELTPKYYERRLGRFFDFIQFDDLSAIQNRIRTDSYLTYQHLPLWLPLNHEFGSALFFLDSRKQNR